MIIFTLFLLIGCIEATGIATSAQVRFFVGKESVNAQTLISFAENDPKAFASIFAENDPKAFAAVFASASPDKLNKIITLLNKLVTEATENVKLLSDDVNNTKQNYTKAKLLEKSKEAQCGSLELGVTRAQDALKVATAKYEKAKEAYRKAEPGIQDEIATINGIIKTISGLIRIQKPSPSYGTSVEEKTPISSYKIGRNLLSEALYHISMLQDLSKADPKAINEVIVLLKELTADATRDLAALKDTLDKARLAFSQATTSVKNAEAASIVCQTELNKLHDLTLEAYGTYEAAEKDFAQRKPVLDKEIATLQKVIIVLKGLMQ